MANLSNCLYHFEDGFTLKAKNLHSLGANSFLSELAAFEKARMDYFNLYEKCCC